MGCDSTNHTPEFDLTPKVAPLYRCFTIIFYIPEIITAKLRKVIYIHSMMFGQADQLLVNGIRFKDNNRCRFVTKAIYDLFKLPLVIFIH